MSDKVRVLRLIEYSGPRAQVEDQLSRSMRDGTHGPGRFNTTDPKREGVTIKIATLGDFPELLARAEEHPVGTVRRHPEEELDLDLRRDLIDLAARIARSRG